MSLLGKYPPMPWWSDESKAAYLRAATKIQRDVDECLVILERLASPQQGKLQLEVA